MVADKKKAYSRPELYYESLTLSQSIATACEETALFGEGSCPVNIQVGSINVMIFQSAESGCDFCPPNADDYICYHAPSEMNNVFAS